MRTMAEGTRQGSTHRAPARRRHAFATSLAAAVAILSAFPADTTIAMAETALPSRIEIGEVAIAHRRGGSITIRELRIDPQRREVSLDRLTARMFEGRFETDSITIDGNGSRSPPVIRIDGIDIASALEFLAIEGLSGEGTLDGEFPLSLDETLIPVIELGYIYSSGPGRIRYLRGGAPGMTGGGGGAAGMALLLQALENFHFERLSLTLNGRLDETMQVGLHLEGRNPDLYGGHPFELNVNLEGALALLAGQALDTWRIPDLLAREVMDVVR